MTKVEESVSRAVEYIGSWKRRELEALATQGKTAIPICIPISKTAFVVGKYGVKKADRTWTVSNGSDQYEFSSRLTALLYALCKQTNYKKVATDILTHDTIVIKLVDQLNILTYHKQIAKRKKDYWRYDHYYIMISDVEMRLAEAKNQLEKSIDLAKYFKVWTD